MSAAQVAGTLLRFPGGELIAQKPSVETLVQQAKEWNAIAQDHHFGARVAIARGDYAAAVKHLIHEHGKILQAIAILKEASGRPRGKRQLELMALQLVLSAVGDELGFLPGVTADDTANTLEACVERVDNVQARLQNLADGFRSSGASERDESSE